MTSDFSALIQALITELVVGNLRDKSSLQEAFRRVVNTALNGDVDIVPEILSTMPYLLDFPFVAPIYTEPVFEAPGKDGEVSVTELPFQKLCRDTLNLFQNQLSRMAYVLSCDPGTGKTRATKEIAKHLKSNGIVVIEIYAKSHEKQIMGYKKDGAKNVLAKICDCESKDLKPDKLAVLFDGLDEICPTYREAALRFAEECAREFKFVWITTRPQERAAVHDKLTTPVNWLSIRKLDSKESEEFLERSLKGFEWKATWDEIKLKTQLDKDLPMTPLLLNMISTLIKNNVPSNDRDGGHKIVQWDSFTIFWNIAEQQISEGAKKGARSNELQLKYDLTACAKWYLMNIEKKFTDGTKDDLNKVGIARFEGVEPLYAHRTFAEFFLCLALLMDTDDKCSLEEMTDILSNPELYKQVRYFLDKAIQITFNDENFSTKHLLENSDLWTEISQNVDKSFKVLEAACKEGRFQIYKHICLGKLADLFEHDLFKSRRSQLLFAACCSNEEIALELLENRGGTMEEMIASSNKDQIIILLMSMAARNSKKLLDKLPLGLPEDDLNMALLTAAGSSHTECIEILARKGAKIGATDMAGNSVLHVVLNKRMEDLERVFAFLLDIVSPEIINKQSKERKETALHIAAEKGNMMVVKQLLSKKAKTDVKDFEGWNAFHCAVASGKEDIVDAILESNEKLINSQTNNNCTPLHLAVRKEDLKMVQYLLEKGANIGIRNMFEETPVHCAAELGHYECRDAILEKQAVPLDQLDDFYNPL